jgi:hypothetical protein
VLSTFPLIDEVVTCAIRVTDPRSRDNRMNVSFSFLIV